MDVGQAIIIAACILSLTSILKIALWGRFFIELFRQLQKDLLEYLDRAKDRN
jgi:hypothetical protein